MTRGAQGTNMAPLMAYAFKRLALGLALIALASAILLVADRERRAPDRGRALRLAIFQHAESTLMEDGVRGVMDGLAARGYRDGEGGSRSMRFNAQGDMPHRHRHRAPADGGGYDLVITSSTPSMQAVANNNQRGPGQARLRARRRSVRRRASASIARSR